MKIHQNNARKSPSFSAYYNQDAVRQLEKTICSCKNPNLTKQDIIEMSNSIASFNAFYDGTKYIDPVRISNELYKKFGIPSDFRGDKILAGCCALAANIFHKLGLAQPKGIYKAPLKPGTWGTCGRERIVKFSDSFHWPSVQTESIEARLANFSSSGHFLKTFIHEFMHNVHVKNLQDISKKESLKYDAIKNSELYKRAQTESDFELSLLIKNGLELKDLTRRQLISRKLSYYGSTLPAEMFAETGTRMITRTLDMRTLRPTRNPFVFKDFTEDKYLMEMMNDFYKGNFDKYI